MGVSRGLQSGTKQWVIQRICNKVIIVYALALFGFIAICSPDFTQWQQLHQALWFKVVSTLGLVAASCNGALAGWQIAGDYIKGAINPLFNGLCFFINLMLLLFGLWILWIAV